MVFLSVMIIEGVNHLTHFVKIIPEENRHLLQRMSEGGHDLFESIPQHEVVELIRHALKHADCLHQPPLVVIRDTLE